MLNLFMVIDRNEVMSVLQGPNRVKKRYGVDIESLLGHCLWILVVCLIVY